jgi:hypothetical protein
MPSGLSVLEGVLQWSKGPRHSGVVYLYTADNSYGPQTS